MLSNKIALRCGEDGLPEDTIQMDLTGSGGQSFAAFLSPGITMRLEGDANDYFCKGLSGGKVVIVPPERATFTPEENTIVGNVALYGATGGQAYIRGIAGERFCVRNSGVEAVVEGVGDHGCEYMTGGRVVVLGPTGRNFAAGMSGGEAYILDEEGVFPSLCNTEMVALEPVEAPGRRRHPPPPTRQPLAVYWQRPGRARARKLGRHTSEIHQDHAARLQASPDGARRKGRKGDIARAFPAHTDLMGKPTGFIDYARVPLPKRPISERVQDWQEFLLDWDNTQAREQAGRCMNCAVPMCHSFTGCPLGNLIPDWNDLVYRDQWDKAIVSLHSTNNFPEFTGRICPAPCETACIVGRPRHYDNGHAEADDPVTIEYIEKSIADHGWENGWITPEPPSFRTGKVGRCHRIGTCRHWPRPSSSTAAATASPSTSATSTSADCSG